MESSIGQIKKFLGIKPHQYTKWNRRKNFYEEGLWFLFCQGNCQEFLVLLVNPQICQDNKGSLKHRETRGSWAQGVLLHWYEG
jgi:hypothetical protein